MYRSSFSKAIEALTKKSGIPLFTIDGVVTPYAVAINHNGELVVTEHDIDSISIFSPSGEKLQSFGTAGHHLGQFTRPWGG